MKGNKHMKTITNIIYSALALACFALSPAALAVDPPPDGGYPNANTAEGDNALFSLDTSQGLNNTAIGFDALYSTTTGNNNTATGVAALKSNTTGNFNTATGLQALKSNTTGSFNTAAGVNALLFNTTGLNNTATGFNALEFMTTGSNNIALGSSAGANLTTGSNDIYVGSGGVATESYTIRIGTQGTQTTTFIAGIRGIPIAGGVAVGVSSSGQLGVRASSMRFKEQIKPMDKASEAIFWLQPVTFRYKKALDPEALPQFGLVAEQVAKVDPDLVVVDDQGKPFTVRYEAVNAMLLNEFLKEHRKVEKLEATVAQQHKDFEAAGAELKGQIQKVSARLEVTKTPPQTVLNNR
jgi:hypothetical protein